MKLRRITALLLSLFLLVALASSCGKTPDQIEEEQANFNLEDVNWSIPIEIEGGETITYTMDQAKVHELTKIFCSYRQSSDNGSDAPQVTTAIMEGVLFQSVLDDIGYPDAKSATVYHNNTTYYNKPFEYDSDIIHGEKTILAWIQNKNQIVVGSSPSYVAFATYDGGVDDLCHSIAKIVIIP